MVPQRHPADCGPAALAMYLGVSYEDVLLAIGSDVTDLLRRGMWFTELTRAAAKFGVTLKRKVQWDADVDEGIAQIRFRSGPHHVVLLRAGLFFDTDFTVWEPSDLLKEKRGRPGSLLMRVDD